MHIAALVLLIPGMLACQMSNDNLPDPGQFFPVPPPFVWGSGGHATPAKPKAIAPVVPPAPQAAQPETQHAQAPQAKRADPEARHRRPTKCSKQRTSVTPPVKCKAKWHCPLLDS
jgi:hypothetical protein